MVLDARMAHSASEVSVGLINPFIGPKFNIPEDFSLCMSQNFDFFNNIEKNIGENVYEDDTVIVLEAMKMETTVKTPIGGKILKIYVQNGDKVKSGDPLFEVST